MIEILFNKNSGIMLSLTVNTIVEDDLGLSQLIAKERSNAIYDESLHSIISITESSPHANGPYTIEEIQRDIHQFIYDTERGFLRRPAFQFYIDEELIETLGVTVKKINTPIKVKLKYYDPDNVKFNEKFTNVKFKDREYMVDFGEKIIQLDPETLSYEVTVTSPFPGVSTFRAKDEFFLCNTTSIQVRYRP